MMARQQPGYTTVEIECLRVLSARLKLQLAHYPLQDGELIESIILDGGKQSYKAQCPAACRRYSLARTPDRPREGLCDRAQASVLVAAPRRVLSNPHRPTPTAEPPQIQGTHVFVTDTNSSHGTYVDGRRIPAQQPQLFRAPAECWFGGSTRRPELERVGSG